MSKSVPAQHPAVVLRSHYRNLRSLLAVAIVAVVGLSTTVVVLTVDEDQTASTVSTYHEPAARLGDPLQSRTQPTRPTGGPDESGVAAAIASKPTSVSGPDESKIAATIGSHSDTGPVTRERAYVKAISQMTPRELAAAYGTEWRK